MQNRPPLGQPN